MTTNSAKAVFEPFNNLSYFMSKSFYDLTYDEKVVWFNEMARKLKGAFLVYLLVDSSNPDLVRRRAYIIRIKVGTDFYNLPASDFDEYCNFYGIANQIAKNLDAYRSTDVKAATKGINRYALKSLCIGSSEVKLACSMLHDLSASSAETHIDEYHVKNLSDDNIAKISEWLSMPVDYMINDNVIEQQVMNERMAAEQRAREDARVPRDPESKKQWAVNMFELLNGYYIVTPSNILKIATAPDILQVDDAYWETYARTCNHVFDLVVQNRANQMLHNEKPTFVAADLLKFDDTAHIADGSPLCLSLEQFTRVCYNMPITAMDAKIRVSNLSVVEKKIIYDGAANASRLNPVLYSAHPILLDVTAPTSASYVPLAVLDDAAKEYIKTMRH